MRTRRLLPLLFLAALAGAGCLEAPPSPFAEFDVETPLVISGGAVGEAFLDVAADGTVLACTHGGFTGPSPSWVSRDFGDTWDPLGTGNPVPAGDCDVAISDEGAWAVLYDYVAGATTAVSRDGGVSWSVNHHGAPPVTGAVDRPWIDWVGERLLMSYKSVQYHPTVLAVTYSDDDGATWATPQVLDTALDPDFPAAIPSDLHIMDDGTAWIFLTSYQTNPAAEAMGLNTEQRYETFQSTDGGETWTRSLVHEGPGEVINGAGVGGDRYLWWAYAGPAPAGDGEAVWVHVSADRGENWLGPVPVLLDQDFDTPAIAGRADGTATLLALNRVGEASVRALRLDATVPGLVVADVQVMGPNDAAQSAEFMDITHAPDGRAFGIFAWDRAPQDCATDPTRPMNTFCLHLVRETLESAAAMRSTAP